MIVIDVMLYINFICFIFDDCIKKDNKKKINDDDNYNEKLNIKVEKYCLKMIF